MNFSVKVNDNIHIRLGVRAKLYTAGEYKASLAI